MDITIESEKATSIARNKVDDIVRFSMNQRVQHEVLMVSFIILSLTGLAQRFYTAGWAEWLIINMGGIAYVRLVHRIFGLLFILSAVYHFVNLGFYVYVQHGKPTMVPTLKDFRDVVQMLRYGFGFADRPPQFGRYDYRQKFEYWGLMLGSIVMIFTGFILAYPVSFTNVFPGEFVAAAKEFHRNEAMLAVLTIAIWHLYDVIFRPGIFPVDMSIHTGKISRERMLHEHPLEYAELMADKARQDTAKHSTEASPRTNYEQLL
ncbi:MAG: cytochrome b/b6 domain-containing protein [Chloroflexi bacterium]|nr:cytochrome b/b6 domain-containing protein [Chloroflexota bacterium]